MGAYSKIVSVLRQIDTAHTFIGGTKADITSAWVFVNGERQQVFPSSEVYTQIYAKTDAGAYSQALPYGRYKIVISGAGGSGCAVARSSQQNISIRTQDDGQAGQEQTIMLDVPYGQTKTVSGIIGQGGTASYARASDSHNAATAGTGGTGVVNGANGERKTGGISSLRWGLASGAGGGASSLDVDNVETARVPGGDGGNVSIRVSAADYRATFSCVGGAGGIGNSTQNGASGGIHGRAYDGSVYSAAGTDGYIRIYQSSIYPN